MDKKEMYERLRKLDEKIDQNDIDELDTKKDKINI